MTPWLIVPSCLRLTSLAHAPIASADWDNRLVRRSSQARCRNVLDVVWISETGVLLQTEISSPAERRLRSCDVTDDASAATDVREQSAAVLGDEARFGIACRCRAMTRLESAAACKPKSIRDPYQFRDGVDAELAHDLAAVDFHRLLVLPSRSAICLFNRPALTHTHTSRSRGVSD